ncbi:MAG TPA: Npt1/Npt2 family nucleotide transporter [Candidatus Babeliales bacterium]|jgi:AAA family ATP:ADP antiporter|nr:Npt1/Npt2 family nucleotide transporter [Candidatus Babeliales bacterium]
MSNGVVSAIKNRFGTVAEFRKFALLAVMFFFIIGIYWTMRPMKDGLFNALVGIDWQPRAKMLSLILIVPLVILYSKLIDTFERHKVFYTLLTFYGLMAAVFAFAFMHPTIGLVNKIASPDRILGWCWYVYVESFGSLVVALFWAITVDTTKPESAKRGFPMIALLGQMGNIFGPLVLTAKNFGFSTSAPIVAICSVLMFLVVMLMYYFMSTTPKELLSGFVGEQKEQESHTEPGFFEGLRLLVTRAYLMGIFLIITIYEAIVTIIDFHFKKTASLAFPVEIELSAYLAKYGWMTGVVATACVLLGVNKIQDKLGIRSSLVLLPLLTAGAVISLWAYPMWLNLVFWIMVTAKAINYALNQPTLKQLYIPTSKDSRYKAQAWIEMFGSRGSKAFGSIVNDFRGALGLAMFLNMVSIVSGGLIIAWLFIAIYVARVYDKAIKENRIVC